MQSQAPPRPRCRPAARRGGHYLSDPAGAPGSERTVGARDAGSVPPTSPSESETSRVGSAGGPPSPRRTVSAGVPRERPAAFEHAPGAADGLGGDAVRFRRRRAGLPAGAQAQHGAEEGAPAAAGRAGPSGARPARAAGPAAGLGALRPGPRDHDAPADRPPAAPARPHGRAPREPPAAAARPPAALRPRPPGDAQVVAVAARRAVLLAPDARAAGLHGAEPGPRASLGRPDFQREDGKRAPRDPAGHVPRLAAGAQARGGRLRRVPAAAPRARRARGRALPAAAPSHDPGRAAQERRPQHGGAGAGPAREARPALGLPGEEGGQGGQGQGQGHPRVSRPSCSPSSSSSSDRAPRGTPPGRGGPGSPTWAARGREPIKLVARLAVLCCLSLGQGAARAVGAWARGWGLRPAGDSWQQRLPGTPGSPAL